MDAKSLSPGEEQMVLIPESSLNRRIEYTWDRKGKWVQIDAIVCTEDQWEKQPESRSALWIGHRLGGMVFAVQCPPRGEL